MLILMAELNLELSTCRSCSRRSAHLQSVLAIVVLSNNRLAGRMLTDHAALQLLELALARQQLLSLLVDLALDAKLDLAQLFCTVR